MKGITPPRASTHKHTRILLHKVEVYIIRQTRCFIRVMKRVMRAERVLFTLQTLGAQPAAACGTNDAKNKSVLAAICSTPA